MQLITEEYLLLFSAVSAAEETLAQLRSSLMEAQQRAEELYLQRTDKCPPSAAG